MDITYPIPKKIGNHIYNTYFVGIDNFPCQTHYTNCISTASANAHKYSIKRPIPTQTRLKSICFKVNTGIESSSKIYGTSKIFDGKKHHVAQVLYNEHLTIAVDGETVTGTILELSQNFYENNVNGINVGDFTLTDFIIHHFISDFQHPDFSDWRRMRAWLKAFYLLQK